MVMGFCKIRFSEIFIFAGCAGHFDLEYFTKLLSLRGNFL